MAGSEKLCIIGISAIQFKLGNANHYKIGVIENQYYSNAVFLSLDTEGDLDLVVFD
jgi:hypothetical protein